MADIDIECPHCRKSFKLNETLAAPLLEQTRRSLLKEIEEREKAVEEQSDVLAEEMKKAEKARKQAENERAALALQREEMEERVAEMVEEQCQNIARQEARKAKQKYEEKLAERDEEKTELEAQVKEKSEKLAEARKQEAELRRKQRDLDEKLEAADAEVEKRVTEALAPMRDKAKRDAEEEHRLTIRERDKKIEDLQAQLKDATRRLEQGSEQLQGEVQELDLEKTLKAKFPIDTIEPVPTGEHGGDVLQRVHGPFGEAAGTILWESKRTKNWSDNWLPKLRENQRAARAEVAIIVSEAMPKDVSTFATIDGVLVVSRPCVVPVAVVMRQQLIELNRTRQASEGQLTKMELLYNYLTGPHFRQRVEAIVEAFTTMQDDLMKERRLITTQWAKREKQIVNAMESTVGMWGDLQGIAGKTLQEIEGLEIPLLEEADADDGERPS